MSGPHWRQTRDSATQANGPVLFLQDGSQLNLTLYQVEGLGRIGNERGRGILIHSTLALLPGDLVTMLGLAHQLPWMRDGESHKPRETRSVPVAAAVNQSIGSARCRQPGACPKGPAGSA